MAKQRFDLKLVSKNKESFAQEKTPQVICEFEVLNDEFLTANFAVSNSKLNASKKYPTDESVWGLWDRDVCEIFISSSQKQNGSHLPYYEFQVSPFAQYFELKIFEPRKKFEEFQSGIEVHAKIMSTQRWTAEIKIPLKNLGLDPHSPIFGNIYSCLSFEPQRAYMALNYPIEQLAALKSGPDFHNPENFIKLVP